MSDEWKCAGCGIPSPGRERKCDCPTNVVTNGRTSAWKVDGDLIEVKKNSLLKVVRKLDLDASMTTQEFAAAFDDLRAAFTPEQIATGEL